MLQPDFSPFPGLETGRLLLRKLVAADLLEIFFLRSDKRIYEHLGKDPAANPEEAAAWMRNIENNIATNESILWGITLKGGDDKVIGTICLWNINRQDYRSEIGYSLHPDHWRKGIMKEAIEKVLEYGFREMKLHSVEGRISPGNIGSAAALEANGFVKEAHFKEDFFYNGKFLDTVVYSKLTSYN